MYQQLNYFFDQAERTLDSIRVNEQEGRAAQQVERLERNLADFKKGIESLQRVGSSLTIGVVGQMKIGKSSFLNALMFEGKEVLPTAATPMTAGLTIIEYTDSIEDQRFEVEYYSTEEWRDISNRSKCVEGIKNDLIEKNKELVNKTKDLEKLLEKSSNSTDYACYLLKQNVSSDAIEKIGRPNDRIPIKQMDKLNNTLANYVGVRGLYTSVVKVLHIYLNDGALVFQNDYTGMRESYRIVDTPGVNDPIVSRQFLTEKFLQEAHAVFMFTDAETFLPEADIRFMNDKISPKGISKIVLIANKLDTLFQTDSNCPNDLKEAMDYAIEHVKNQFEDRKIHFNSKPIDVFCTSGLAECLRLKMSNNIVLDEYENRFLEKLQRHFLEDFEDESTTLDSLGEISGFDLIRKMYIQGIFLANKDKIITEKISDFIRCNSNLINDDFKSIFNEIENELSLAKVCDVNTLDAQISALQNLRDVDVANMQTRIIKFSKGLQDEHANRLFEETLVSYKPKLEDGYCDSKSVSYTRETTFWGRTVSGYVYVNVLNPNSVVKSENEQIDKLRAKTNKEWTSIYRKEEDSLKEDMLGIIQKMSSKDSSLNISVDIFEAMIMRCIVDSLSGRSQLRLEEKCSEQQQAIAEYVNSSVHTSFSKSFGEMSEDDADEKIKKQATDNLKNFESGMQIRNNAVYKELKIAVNLHCQDINRVMTDFSNTLTQRIETQLNQTREEIINTRVSVEERCGRIEKRKEYFEDLYNQFNSLCMN